MAKSSAFAYPRLAWVVSLLALCLLAAAPARSQGDLRLPEAVSPQALATLLESPPAGFVLVDLRSPEAFADWHVAGSVNRDAAGLLHDAELLHGAGPVVLADQGGTQAMAVAALLAQKTARPVLALIGGLRAYWLDLPQTGGTPAPALTPPEPASPAAPAMPKPGRPLTPPPSKPKSTSAGC